VLKSHDEMKIERKHYLVKGIVQGVGFRPFVFNLAHQLGLSGWISNTNEGVVIEIQGNPKKIDKFIYQLYTSKPKNASILDLLTVDRPIKKENGFFIKKSDSKSKPNTIILPDLAPCADCLRDINTPGNRRYRYPFTNCINCGPRFSIVQKLPYDRKHTTMDGFVMCVNCQKEYDDPTDRRFHAQPNACPQCGPYLSLWDSQGKVLETKEKALLLTCEYLRQGAIIALKGVGGFQLLVDINNEESIEKLRIRKNRKEKPFAVMYPTLDLVRTHCEVSTTEEQLLTSQEAPIVLLKTKINPSSQIASNNPYMGVMLPSSPLHYLLLKELNSAVIATSGNRSDEPICIDENEALTDLQGIADYFLVHDRPIAQYVDDSIVRVIAQRKLILRRARGYASMPIFINHQLPSALAVGGHMKNTVAVSRGHTVYLSQHIGDLENQKAYACFSEAADELLKFYEITPEIIVSDCHPDYSSTQFAADLNKPISKCQHHVAHVYSCMAENKVEPPLLGVSWDGTGYGLDETVWGGEFFHVQEDFSVERIAHLRPFKLPCGEKAVREPRLSAIGMLYELFGSDLFDRKELYPVQTLSEAEIYNLRKLLTSGFQSPKCSSMGRVFDAVSSMLGLRQEITFEGQAAMEMEFLAEYSNTSASYPFQVIDYENDPHVIDWKPMMMQIIEEMQTATSKEEIAAKFHNTLVEIIVAIAKMTKQKRVLLSGGVFQNKVLAEKSVEALIYHHLEPYWHQEVPPNDGGIALGQLYSLSGAKKG